MRGFKRSLRARLNPKGKRVRYEGKKFRKKDMRKMQGYKAKRCGEGRLRKPKAQAKTGLNSSI